MVQPLASLHVAEAFDRVLTMCHQISRHLPKELKKCWSIFSLEIQLEKKMADYKGMQSTEKPGPVWFENKGIDARLCGDHFFIAQLLVPIS